MDKYKSINFSEHHSLDQLDWQPGEILGFDNRSVDGGSQPFLLVIPQDLRRNDLTADLTLKFRSRNGEETWGLSTNGLIMALEDPGRFAKDPVYRFVRNIDYHLEFAYSGLPDVCHGLAEASPSMKYYAEALLTGELVTTEDIVSRAVAYASKRKPFPRFRSDLLDALRHIG
ncbi:MAG: hypothetical protein WCV90_08465 [Candidatus Woesearchaeota archaeon]|jgi:hypothetical protein